MSFRFEITGDRELVLYLDSMGKKINTQINSALNDIGKHLESSVKDKFGKYQKGWPKLKRASVIAKYKRRALKGVRSNKSSRLANGINVTIGNDDPLVLFSKLKESISREVQTSSKQVVVFSDNPYSAVHEYGYKNVPSRSYMRLTLDQEKDEVLKILINRIEKAL